LGGIKLKQKFGAAFLANLRQPVSVLHYNIRFDFIKQNIGQSDGIARLQRGEKFFSAQRANTSAQYFLCVRAPNSAGHNACLVELH
jgi:hypothetical protein